MNELREFRKMIEGNINATRQLVRVDDLTVEELQDIIGIYDRYILDHNYKTKDIFRFKGELFEVISDHTSQADWVPNELPAIYKAFMPEDIIDIWVQPLGGHDSYSKGDKVIYEGLVYVSIVDNNVWEPTVHGWKLNSKEKRQNAEESSEAV